MVYIALSSYLKGLKDKGEEAPSITALADDIGMHKGSLNRLANNRVKQLNLSTANKIIAAMHRRGFKTTIGDILKYVPDEKPASTP